MKIGWPILVIIFLTTGSLLAQTSVGFRGGFTESSASYRVTLGSFPRSITGLAAPTYSLVIEQFFEKTRELR